MAEPEKKEETQTGSSGTVFVPREDRAPAAADESRRVQGGAGR
jgi:hypothetical protein